MEDKCVKKTLRIIGIMIAALACIFLLTFRNELKTITHIEKVNNYPFYKMDYAGDYGLDELLENGVSSDAELAQFATKKLLKGIPIKINVPNLGCTTFNVETKDHDHLFARNFDLTKDPTMIVKTHPKNGYKSISMVNPGIIGIKDGNISKLSKKVMLLVAPYIPLDGINEKGVSIAVLRLPDKPTNQKTNKTDITTTIAIRMVLDRASSVNQAVKLLSKYDMHSSANTAYHFQIADQKGNSAVVEYVDNHLKILSSKKQPQVATNFYLSPGAHYMKGNGQDRYVVVKNRLKSKDNTLSTSQAMSLLQDVHMEKNSKNKMETQWSTVYNLDQKTMELVIGHNPKNKYTYQVN